MIVADGSKIGRVLLARICSLVLSGSVPPGVPPDGYATLARQATAAGVPVLLDADATALRRGVAGRPAIAKPNWEELHRATSARDPRAGAEALRRAGAEAVVVSLGPDGLLASAPEGGWLAVPPERLAGNPTGAGDAAVAALAVGVVSGQPWPLRLTHGGGALRRRRPCAAGRQLRPGRLPRPPRSHPGHAPGHR